MNGGGERAIEVAYGALLEVGRPDLTELIIWYDDDDGGYLEANDDILSDADWVNVDRAEALARQSIGFAPLQRVTL